MLKQPNLDAPEETHLFFDTGDGTIITVFVNDNRESAKGSQRVGTGGLHHLYFSVDPDRFEEVAEALDDKVIDIVCLTEVFSCHFTLQTTTVLLLN